MDIMERALMDYLRADAPYGDITTEVVLGEEMIKHTSAVVVAGEDCLLAGMEVAEALLDMAGCTVSESMVDGDRVEAGTVVMKAHGPSAGLLIVERTMLNILSRMSGIATLTAEAVERARKANPDVRVAATRKTTPGFSLFEKMAVLIGGGDTHRMDLSDMILIKDNHIALSGGVAEAVRSAREKASFAKKVEVEVESLEDALKAVEAGADIVMLDNFTPAEAQEAYGKVKAARPSVIVEVSGGITVDNVADYAPHADVVSMGSLTSGYRTVDFTMEMKGGDV